MKLVKILVIGLFILTFFNPNSTYAQQCSGGVTCCASGDVNCQYTYPGDCDENCNANCGGGDPIDSGCNWSNATPAPGGGIPVTPCNAPQNVNCPLNSSCTPSGIYSCNTYNINYNSYTTSVFDGPNGNAVCSLGNAQTSDHSCNAWFCGYTVTTYACCPAGSVSMWYWSQPANTTHTVSQCDNESTNNCWPGTFVSWVPSYQCGVSARDEEGNREPLYVGVKTCRPPQVKVHFCQQNCTASAPSTPTLLSPSNGGVISTTNVSLMWNNTSQTWGTACSTQNNQFRVFIGTSPSALALLGTVGSGTGSVAFSGSTGQTYYWQIRATNGRLTTSSPVWSFTITTTGPWWQTKDGDVIIHPWV